MLLTSSQAARARIDGLGIHVTQGDSVDAARALSSPYRNPHHSEKLSYLSVASCGLSGRLYWRVIQVEISACYYRKSSICNGRWKLMGDRGISPIVILIVEGCQ